MILIYKAFLSPGDLPPDPLPVGGGGRPPVPPVPPDRPLLPGGAVRRPRPGARRDLVRPSLAGGAAADGLRAAAVPPARRGRAGRGDLGHVGRDGGGAVHGLPGRGGHAGQCRAQEDAEAVSRQDTTPRGGGLEGRGDRGGGHGIVMAERDFGF